MSIVQSIDSAREEHIGPHGVGADALKAALARAEGALDWLRARHADRSLPLLRLPETRSDLETIRDTARQLADRATDIVILGTGGSSLGGQTLAQLAGFAVPGVGALRAPPQLHFIDNLDPDSFGTLLARLPHATTRFVAISKSGGTAETLMQTIAALSAVEEARDCKRAFPISFWGSASRPSPARRTACAICSANIACPCSTTIPASADAIRRSPMSVCCRRRCLGLDIAAVREGAGLALAPVLAKKPAAQVPAAVGAALSVALSESKGKSISVLMAYCDRLAALHALVCAALGRKSRQKRQGHDAARGARAGRPAQPAAVVHRRSARQAVHCHHGRWRGDWSAHRRRARQTCGRTGFRRQDHR